MIEFQYVAKTKDGEVQKGAVEAENPSAAAKVLSSRELYPIDIFVKEKSSLSLFNRVPIKDKAFLMRQLATTINAGLPIAQALQTLREQITNKKIKEILDQVSRDVEGGMALSASFSRFPDVFNQIDVTLLAAGETSGTLDKVMLRMAQSIENDYRLTRKIRSALAYPSFILVVVIIVIGIMSVFVMPQMEGLYASFDAQLPLLTRIMIGFSHLTTRFWPLFIIMLVALAFAARSYVKTPAGRYQWDYFKLHAPIFGKLMQNIYLSRFSRTLAGLVGSGVSLIDSLNIVSKAIGNTIYYNLITEAAKRVKSGIPLSTPLKQAEEFPPIVSQMIRVGEQTGELDNMLSKLADYFEEEVDNFVKSLTSIIEPLVIVIMAVFVGFVLVAIMMPIYNIGKVIR